MRHAIVDHQVGEIGEAQQPRLFPAQFQNSRYDLAIIELTGCGPHAVGVIHLPADPVVVKMRHQRHVARRLQREPPARDALRHGALPGRRNRTGRQAAQFRFVGDHQLERVGRIENML